MGKAWRSGAKTTAERYVIYRYDEGGCLVYERLTDAGSQRLARSFAEHEVCAGHARYVERNPNAVRS